MCLHLRILQKKSVSFQKAFCIQLQAQQSIPPAFHLVVHVLGKYNKRMPYTLFGSFYLAVWVVFLD